MALDPTIIQNITRGTSPLQAAQAGLKAAGLFSEIQQRRAEAPLRAQLLQAQQQQALATGAAATLKAEQEQKQNALTARAGATDLAFRAFQSGDTQRGLAALQPHLTAEEFAGVQGQVANNNIGAITQQLGQATASFQAQGLLEPGAKPNLQITNITKDGIEQPAIVNLGTGEARPIGEGKPSDASLKADENRIKADLEATKTDFERTQKIRKELANINKQSNLQRAALSRIEVSVKDPSAAGDLALIFNFMKMLDPGSTVREGEFATAEQAAGVPTRIVNIYNKVASGKRLNDKQRADFIKTARNIGKSADNIRKIRERPIRQTIKKFSLDEGLIFQQEAQGGTDAADAADARIAELKALTGVP